MKRFEMQNIRSKMRKIEEACAGKAPYTDRVKTEAALNQEGPRRHMYIPNQQLRIVHQEMLREALERQSTQPRRPPKRLIVKEKHK